MQNCIHLLLTEVVLENISPSLLQQSCMDLKHNTLLLCSSLCSALLPCDSHFQPAHLIALICILFFWLGPIFLFFFQKLNSEELSGSFFCWGSHVQVTENSESNVSNPLSYFVVKILTVSAKGSIGYQFEIPKVCVCGVVFVWLDFCLLGIFNFCFVFNNKIVCIYMSNTKLCKTKK